MKPKLPIETQRLRLRAFRDSDFTALERIRSLEEVARFIPWHAAGGEQARAALARKIAASELGPASDAALSIAVELREPAALIGDLTLFHTAPEERTCEVGLYFDPAHHGRGYAAEAVRELLRIGFEEFGMRRLTARTDDRNLASARLFERLGFRREAHLIDNQHIKGELTSELDFALLEREWRASRA